MGTEAAGGATPPPKPPPPPPPPPAPPSGGSGVSGTASGSASASAPAGRAPSATGGPSSTSPGSAVQRQLQQDRFEPAATRASGQVSASAGARMPPASRTQAAPASQPAQERQRDRFQVNMSPENRAHLQRQAGEVSQKWNQFTGWAQRTGDWFRNNVPGVKQLNDAGAAVGDFAGTWGMRGAQAVGADKWKVPDQVRETVLNVADAATRPVLQNRALMDSMMTKERFSYGVGMQAAGTVEGVHSLVTNPGEAARGLGNAAMHPIETGKAIGGALKEQWNKDPVELAGRAAFEIGSALLPAAKAGAVGKAGEVAENVAKAGRVANGVEDAARAARVASTAERAGQAAEVARGVERAGRVGETARAAEGVGEAARAGRAAETATEAASGGSRAGEAARTAAKAEDAAKAGSKLASGSDEYNALRQTVQAKEDLARRLRDSAPGGRHEVLPGGRGHAMSGATGEASAEQLAGRAAKLEKEAAEGRKVLEEADRAADAAKAATPRNVWIEDPKQFPHKINGSRPTRGMMNDNGTVRYQWLDDQKRVVQEAAVKQDGRVVWGQSPAGRVSVPEGARPAHTPNPITGAPKGNEIRGHFTPYEMTGEVSNSGANMGKQSVIMNGTNPYRGLEEAAVEFGKENPGKANYLVVSKADEAGVETARRQVLYFRPPEGGRIVKEFDRTTQAISDASHPLQQALENARAPKPPKAAAPPAEAVAPPAPAPAPTTPP